jgi:hypothetical protein
MCGGTIQLPAEAPALNLRGVVARYVSLYLGLPVFGLPVPENLSEGSVLFMEFSFFVASREFVRQGLTDSLGPAQGDGALRH